VQRLRNGFISAHLFLQKGSKNPRVVFQRSLRKSDVISKVAAEPPALERADSKSPVVQWGRCPVTHPTQEPAQGNRVAKA